MGWGGDGRVGAHISDVPGLVKQISTPADENASIMSVAAMLSMALRFHPVKLWGGPFLLLTHGHVQS